MPVPPAPWLMSEEVIIEASDDAAGRGEGQSSLSWIPLPIAAQHGSQLQVVSSART